MPFQSAAQQRWAFSNPSKLGGLAKVREWASKTDFSHLPQYAPGSRVPKPQRKHPGQHAYGEKR